MPDKNEGVSQEHQNNKDTLDQLVKEHRDANEKLEIKKSLCSSAFNDIRKDEEEILERVDKMSESAELTAKSREALDHVNTSLVDRAETISGEIEHDIELDPKFKDIGRVHQESWNASFLYDIKEETLDIILADANNTPERSLEVNNLKNELKDAITKTSKYHDSKIKYVEQEQEVKEIFEKVDKYAKDNNMTNPLIPETSKAETSANQTEVSEVSIDSSNSNKRKADTLDNETEASIVSSNSKKRSNVEDFADPSLEMPSYMDPED